MKSMLVAASGDQRVARLIDANLDRAREGLRVVEDWCRFGLDRQDLVIRLKDWRQRLGAHHHRAYKEARSTATDSGAGLGHPAQLERDHSEQIVAANCGRIQEALRVLEEFGRDRDPELAATAAAIRYGIYDLEVTVLQAGDHQDRLRRLQASRLYLVTSPVPNLVAQVAAALQAGVSLVQYRAKEGHDLQRLEEARALADLCKRHQALFIVNDRIDLALLVDADGVHLGQEDLPTRDARALIGPHRLLGRSTHQLEQLRTAQNEGCDYVGVGPVYATATKPDRTARGLHWVEEASRHASIPWFAIGGIDAGRLDAVRAAGAHRVAVVRAIMEATDAHAASHALLTALS